MYHVTRVDDLPNSFSIDDVCNIHLFTFDWMYLSDQPCSIYYQAQMLPLF